MTLWDSTRLLKAANDARLAAEEGKPTERRKGCAVHSVLWIGSRAQWCTRCGALKVNGGEWILPRRSES
jgi:hypothetical protein